MGIGGPNARPVIPQAACPLAQLGIVRDTLENVFQIITDRGQVAGTELRVVGR